MPIAEFNFFLKKACHEATTFMLMRITMLKAHFVEINKSTMSLTDWQAPKPLFHKELCCTPMLTTLNSLLAQMAFDLNSLAFKPYKT